MGEIGQRSASTNYLNYQSPPVSSHFNQLPKTHYSYNIGLEPSVRQQALAQMMSKLQKISEEYNVAVMVTNQMTSDPGATMSFQADPKKPIGGNIIAHASTTRISLRKGRGELRIAKIYDSPDLPENEATFSITTGGLDDAKD